MITTQAIQSSIDAFIKEILDKKISGDVKEFDALAANNIGGNFGKSSK